ncbi:thiamine-phosphate synthase family protein [Salinigranum sp. GCM10025319]|uniref:thiamine-phosphate synthase family protein n=1 Tax=Salinigranum sp. GCM10025319 TaxID=3252687 RepID=UPI0036095977
MSLVLPSELVADRVVPTLRAMLARRLDDRGATQQSIAAHLGVSQAAVSNYLDGFEGEPLVAEHPDAQATVERVAASLDDGDLDGYDALAELVALVREFEDRGPICELHEREMPELRGLGCDLCVRGVDSEAERERAALASVRNAARRLATTPGVAGVVPNVGTNVGEALPGGTEVTDVAAIPGRIYTMNGRVEVPANPEFGASRHVATAVLAAASVDPSVRGAVNVATDDGLLEEARARGLRTLEFDADYEDRGDHLRERFAEGVPDLAYHRGAFGVEPITYVFGETAVDAAERVVALVAEDT